MKIHLNFEANLFPCTKCCTDEHIELVQSPSGYSMVSTLVCQNCKEKTASQSHSSVSYDFTTIIKEWNRKNDINSLIAIKEKEQLELSKNIEYLKSLRALDIINY